MNGESGPQSKAPRDQWISDAEPLDIVQLFTTSITLAALLAMSYSSLRLYDILNPDSSSYTSNAAELNSALATTFLAIVTLITLMANNRTTKKNLKLTQIMAEAQIQPQLSVEVEWGEKPKVLYMALKNVGRGVAKNVQFRNVVDFEIIRGKKLSDVSFIKNGIKYVPLNQEYRTWISILKHPTQSYATLHFVMSYEDVLGKKYEEEVHIDLESFRPIIHVVGALPVKGQDDPSQPLTAHESEGQEV